MYPGGCGAGDVVPPERLDGTGEPRSTSASDICLSEDMAVPASNVDDACGPSGADYAG
jgi:hypothetical protein